MKLGTFGDLRPHPVPGKKISPPERMAQMLEMAKLADDAGLDLIGVGDHHGLDYVNSATATTIAAMAAVTKRIRLTSAKTLIATRRLGRSRSDAIGRPGSRGGRPCVCLRRE